MEVVDDAAGGPDDDVGAALEADEVSGDAFAADEGHGGEAIEAAEVVEHLMDLVGELARGHEHDRLDRGVGGVDGEGEREAEGEGLAGTGLGEPDEVFAVVEEGHGLALDWCGLCEAERGDGVEAAFINAEGTERLRMGDERRKRREASGSGAGGGGRRGRLSPAAAAPAPVVGVVVVRGGGHARRVGRGGPHCRGARLGEFDGGGGSRLGTVVDAFSFQEEQGAEVPFESVWLAATRGARAGASHAERSRVCRGAPDDRSRTRKRENNRPFVGVAVNCPPV